MYKKFKITIQFANRVYGGLPRQEDIVEAWTNAKIKNSEKAKKVSDKLKKDVELLDKDEEMAKARCGFRTFNGKGVYLADYQIKAMLREAAKTLKFFSKDYKGFRQTFQHGLFIKPTDIKLADKPHGFEDFAGHVMGPRGQRSVLKRADYVEKVKVNFEIWIVDNGDIADDKIKNMVELSQEIGLGSMRSFQKGKWNLIEFKKLNRTK